MHERQRDRERGNEEEDLGLVYKIIQLLLNVGQKRCSSIPVLLWSLKGRQARCFYLHLCSLLCPLRRSRVGVPAEIREVEAEKTKWSVGLEREQGFWHSDESTLWLDVDWQPSQLCLLSIILYFSLASALCTEKWERWWWISVRG